MKLVRELPNVHGNVWWPAWSLVRNQAGVQESLRTEWQKTPALIPAYTWLDSKAPAAVEGLKADGNKLVWNQKAKDAADPMQKALFYGVYCNGTLLKLVPDAEFEVEQKGKYTVTVVDRCWNESRGVEVEVL
jgi:hypothetical protein